MRFFLAILFASAPLLCQTCNSTVTPASPIPAAGLTNGQIAVTNCTGFAWTAVANNSWLHITSGLSYTGNANVTFTADANPTAFTRTGFLTVAAQQVTITQAAAVCTFDIAPKSLNFPIGGGPGIFAVTSNCIWTASGFGNFITVTNNTVVTGNGNVNFAVAPNGCVAGRNGSISVNTGLANPPVFSITQDGSQGNLTLSASSAAAGPDASDGRFTITTGTGCPWTASSDVTWMQITSGSSGSGNGAVAYHLLANATASRTGSIHVGALTYTVTQASSGPPAPVVTSVNSAANYRTDAVSPGEIVALFGSNMGPAKIVTLQVSNGAITNSLSGTQVLFDGAPAPLIYTLATQVSAIVPYGVAGKSSTQVQVVYNGATSTALTMAVQLAHPGIFTADASGTGPGAILNQDSTLNSVTNAAARGSVVAIYATGGGATNPALSDGAVTGLPLPYLTQAATVSIGGIEAQVQYAGGVPGAVAGLTQINAAVPAGVTPGAAVPVVLRIGGFVSSSGVTVAVK